MEDFLKSKEVMAMEEWKNYIGNANVDIFDVLKNAIKVAASDHPNEFRTMRDKIAEMLFSRELINYCGGGDMFKKQSMNVSCEVQDETIDKVLRIKAILDKKRDIHGYESEAGLVNNSLRKLQAMELSYEILEATGIEKSVNAQKKHQFREVSETARMVINTWKRMVKERPVDANENELFVVEEKEDECGESVNTDHHATGIGKTLQKHASKDVSQQRNMDEWLNKKSSVVKPISVQDKPRSLDMEKKINSGKTIVPRVTPQQQCGSANLELVRNNQKGPRVTLGLQCKSQIISKVTRHNQKAPRVLADQQSKSRIISKVAANNQKGPRVAPDQQCKSRMNSKEATNNKSGPTNTSFEEKFEATKRKFQQHYMEEENLKKKRRIQVLELHEVIKKGRIPPKDQQVRHVYKQFRR